LVFSLGIWLSFKAATESRPRGAPPAGEVLVRALKVLRFYSAEE